jgi:hypothetical protein
MSAVSLLLLLGVGIGLMGCGTSKPNSNLIGQWTGTAMTIDGPDNPVINVTINITTPAGNQEGSGTLSLSSSNYPECNFLDVPVTLWGAADSINAQYGSNTGVPPYVTFVGTHTIVASSQPGYLTFENSSCQDVNNDTGEWTANITLTKTQ